MPSIDYARLRAGLRILDLLRRMGWRATVCQGEQLRGPCPLCAKRHGTASSSRRPHSVARVFSVQRERNLFRCFRCGAAGNALDLWSAYRGLPLHAAALELLADIDRPAGNDPDPTDQATAKH